MATSFDALSVKGLNKPPGRRRFVFKTFSQRLEEIDIDVYRSLDKIESEPSEGSSFFRDCLIEWRELNTAEDFISYYEEILPLVQTLPMVLLHKDVIMSNLLHRLKIKARLSLEPVLRLISALSRDLLEDFLPYLPRIVDALASLLESGADREPEIIEQIFYSWSQMMMYLQKYLTQDIAYVLKATIKLRYYFKEYVQDFMAEAISFLLRNAPVEQLKKGVRRVMLEVVKKQFDVRKAGVGALLYNTMRGTSLKFHSKAERLLRILLDKSVFRIGETFSEGSEAVIEVIVIGFRRLCQDLEAKELDLLWNCLYQEIMEAINDDSTSHLDRLLALLTSTVCVDNGAKISDYGPLLQLVEMLVQKVVACHVSVVTQDVLPEVLDKILKLMLCILSGLQCSNNLSAFHYCSMQWSPVFELQNLSLLEFIGQILQEEPSILRAFNANISRALDNSITKFPEQVIYLYLSLHEKMQTEPQDTTILREMSGGALRIQQFVHQMISKWVSLIKDFGNGDYTAIQADKTELALLWGVTCCYPHVFCNPEDAVLLSGLIDGLDQLLTVHDDDVLVFPRHTWQSLIGAALRSHNKLSSGAKSAFPDVGKVMQLAKRHKSSPHVLVAVADYLDNTLGCWPSVQGETHYKYHPEFQGNKLVGAVDIFEDNLCHHGKDVRISTLRILCKCEALSHDSSTSDRKIRREQSEEIIQMSARMCEGDNVLALLLSIEASPLSVSTSRKLVLLISKIQMDLSAGRIPEIYISLLLKGIIGIFYNRFSYLWDPALECLAVLISRHVGTVWDRFMMCLDECQSIFRASVNHLKEVNAELLDKSSGLAERFEFFVNPQLDSNPNESVLSLLIQSLQKIPSITEARSRQFVPLFLKFLGYNVDELSSVGCFDVHSCKGKQWKCILKEWLNLLKLMRNPKAFYQSQFLKEVLQTRLLDENDPEIQMKVLDCLLTWKDEFLLPYEQHLKNMVNTKTLREELTTWSLSRDSNQIEESHRAYIVPLVIGILVPKVRKLKALASRKHTSLHHRKAVLGFIAQLDVDELPLFFALLMKPLKEISMENDVAENWFWVSGRSSMDDFLAFNVLKHFTVDNMAVLSWKKKSGFLHVIADVLATLDESRISPFLHLLMGSVVLILAFCTCQLERGKCKESYFSNECSSLNQNHNEDAEPRDGSSVGMTNKQLKNMRSLCLKIISSILNKHEEHAFGDEVWDLFFRSVKPLIDGFKQEGSSSKKPSSLFSCFLALSRSYRLVSLLNREKSLVADMFSMLTITTVSEAIVSGVLKFIENLLSLHNDAREEDSNIGEVLLPNLEQLICCLQSLFLSNTPLKRKLVKQPSGTLINVFKLLPKYVKDQFLGGKMIDVLLQFLNKGSQNTELCHQILQVIRDVVPVLGGRSTKEILVAVSPLLTWAELDMRLSISDILVALAESDPSILIVGKLVRELNATASMEIEGLDYDRIINAYEKINLDLFSSFEVDHALIILSQFVYDIVSDDLILRHSAYRSLLAFTEFSAGIIDRDLKNGQKIPDALVVHGKSLWTKSSIQYIIDKFILKHLGDSMKRKMPIQKEWIDLLREMVLRLPEIENLNSLKPLCSQDAEVDFFHNMVHLQTHRRARALVRFRNVISTSNMSQEILNKIFVPMFFNKLFDVQDGRIEQIRNACLEALASIAGHVRWRSYFALLMRCFREMNKDPEKQKLLLRLICHILDQFHFAEVNPNHEFDRSLGTALNADKSSTASVTLKKCTSIASTEIRDSLQKNVLPRIQKLLNGDLDKLNVDINLAALKLLKLLSQDILESQLPSIIHRAANLLKSRSEGTRDEARSALAACLKELGLEYLQFIVNTLRATLRRGYELHVLGYTLNFILSKLLASPSSAKLDYCMEDLLSVVESDILGDVSEEKEVEKIASKMKETRKRKSFETLKLIAQNITFRSNALKLLSPVTVNMQKHLTPKQKAKLESMLSHIATGIDCNPSVDQTDLFVFVYGLIEDGIRKEKGQGENFTVPSVDKHQEKYMRGDMVSSRQVFCNLTQGSHIITVFALGLLVARLKNLKLDMDDMKLLSMLDPFVKLLCNCLSSKYEDIISASLRCLTPLVRLPLPSLETQADSIKQALFDIAQSSVNSSSLLTQSCLRLLTVLLRTSNITLSSEQLQMLLQFPLFVDLERNPSFVALSLLKAIISRKLVVHEIYDVVKQIGELMVTSQVDSIRKKCSQILLQFLLGYHLSEKRLQQHIDFLLSNLSYVHSTGREAVLEMLHAIIIKFPGPFLDEQSKSLFIHLVISLANDHDNRVRSMTGAAIKLLVGRISSKEHILEYTLSWYFGEKRQLWSAAAQVLGLMVEVMEQDFQKYISGLLPVVKNILHSSVTSAVNTELDFSDEAHIPIWKEAYYTLVMLEKILHQFQHLSLEGELEGIWGSISELLLHPHLWLRTISSRLLALYFEAVTEAQRGRNDRPLGDYFLLRTSRLFHIAVSLCCQLKTQLADDNAGNLVAENLIFVMSALNSLMGHMEPLACMEFWHNLGHDEQISFLKAFHLLDPRNGRAIFLSLTSGIEHHGDGHSRDARYLLTSSLLKMMGKIALQMESIQLKIVFRIFQEFSSLIGSEDALHYASELLLPLYKVCEGFAGKSVSENLKQLAQEVLETLRSTLGIQNFVQVYSQIRRDLKHKRDKRKQDEKLMAVINPVRNAKRKLRIAAKHRAHKKRKIMTLKFGRWMH